jgi:hypothetical protein
MAAATPYEASWAAIERLPGHDTGGVISDAGRA